MDPYLAIIIGLIILVLILLIGMIVMFKDNLSERIHNLFHGNGFCEEDVTEEEIISMVNEGHEHGVLQASEAEMIHNILEFDEKEAKDIMTHRKNIVAIDGNLSFTDAVTYMIENSKSRYPVYMEDVDNIIGVLHIKDAFSYVQRLELIRTAIKDIPGLIREVDFIPETLKINKLFKTMQTSKNHMYIVIDEYGQTSGLVAMEDVLEEIVGNIEDEHDDEQELISMLSDGSYQIDGMASLEDVFDKLEIPYEEDFFDTLNGYLISLIGKIPADDEVCEVDALGYHFKILEVEDKIIKKVQVSKIKTDL